jgi:pyrroloquinoline quinone biosynthesis protein E
MGAMNAPSEAAVPRPGPPLWLLAELTYKCPLHCVYCYNPTDYTRYSEELTTEDWKRVFREARALGSVQLGFSGGEPLVRDDLEELVAEAHSLGYYTNLITSGVGLNEKRIAALKEAGLDHIQLSFQDSTKELNDFLSSTKTFDLKSRVGKLVKTHGYPMVLNCTLHRLNIDHVGKIIEMADALGVEYLELANTQFYGWAFENRAQLMPSQEQVERAEAEVARARERIGHGGMRILFVVPDYHASRPKACMNGWGAVFLTIAPDGAALPCHSARILPGLQFPDVRTSSIEEIWYRSDAFNLYRGDAWMREPCRTCPEKGKDFGGCRCQAFLLTGDATNADPVCALSPKHHRVTAVAQAARAPQVEVKPILFRTDANARKFAGDAAKV